MDHGEAYLDELFPPAPEDYLHYVGVGDFLDEHAALGQLDGCETLQARRDKEADWGEKVPTIFESLWGQQHVDGTIALAKGKKCLDLCHFLLFDFSLHYSSLSVLYLDDVSLSGCVGFNPVHFPHGVGDIPRIHGCEGLGHRILRPATARVIYFLEHAIAVAVVTDVGF